MNVDGAPIGTGTKGEDVSHASTVDLGPTLGVDLESGDDVALPEGRGRAVMIVGDTGCGKTAAATRLASRLARGLRDDSGERVTVLTSPAHAGVYAGLSRRRASGMNVDLARDRPDAGLPGVIARLNAPYLSVTLPEVPEKDGGAGEWMYGLFEVLRARGPGGGTAAPSHLIVDSLHGLLDRYDLITLLLDWKGSGRAADSSLAAATVSPFVPMRLPEGFGSLLVMRSAPERITDHVEDTVFGPVLTGRCVTRPWYRYHLPDDALPVGAPASLCPGEGVLLEVLEDGGVGARTPMFVDLESGERDLLGARRTSGPPDRGT